MDTDPVRSAGGGVRRFVVTRWFDETGSTQLDALALLARQPDGVVVVADHQRAGRGRLRRRWESTPGASLLFSVGVRLGDSDPEPQQLTPHQLTPHQLTPHQLTPHQLTTALALAGVEAVRDLAAVELGLKWPNDLVAAGGARHDGPYGGDLKVGGILAELHPEGLVIGMGLNHLHDAVPEELAEGATSLEDLAEGGIVPERRRLLDEILVRFEERFDRLRLVDTGPAELRRDQIGACVTLGRRVRVDLPDGTVEGVASGLGAGGELLVETGAGSVSVTAGDVVHLRPSGIDHPGGR